MIIGIGTDIIEISRFKNISQSFINKIFSPNEIIYLSEKKAESIAGMFAAKEAVIKAFGVDSNKKFFLKDLKDIEVLHNKKNAPLIKLNNGALDLSKQINIKKINISISHSKNLAIAFAILESWLILKTKLISLN